MVADIEVDKVADIDIDMEIQFGERVGHGGWLIGPKLFDPACASSQLCEFFSFYFRLQQMIQNDSFVFHSTVPRNSPIHICNPLFKENTELKMTILMNFPRQI